MAKKYARMDAWSDDRIARFKEDARQPRRRPRGLRAAAPAPALVAEGDSWFDYPPGTDLIDCLRGIHGCEIESFARRGDTLENMIYGTGVDSEFRRAGRTIDLVLRRIRQRQPKVFLFSGGGNDVAGDEFESYLNHSESGLPALRAQYLQYMVGTVFRKYYEDLIAKVAAVSPGTHIITHGYGHTVPTGKGTRLLWITWAGPWLRPALARKGIFRAAEQRKAVDAVIDAFNGMLKKVGRAHRTFHYVDLRSLIRPKTDWADELHLVNSAYARAADRLYETIESVLRTRP